MFLFKEVFKETIWGGDRILRMKEQQPTSHSIGESWEISGIPGHETLVSEGPEKGKSLKELAGKYGAELLGRHVMERFGTEFPLLVKFIDAHDDLSIQVHPDDELARARGHAFGKTEMWYVMDVLPNSRLLVGFNRHLTLDEYDQAVNDGSIARLMRTYDVKSGDVFFLPPGRVHAIGSGVLLAEIQQSSDITYRIFDYGRTDKEGKARELHTELAKPAIDFDCADNDRTRYSTLPDGTAQLAKCNYFKTKLLTVENTMEIPIAIHDSFSIILCMEGEVDIEQHDGILPSTATLRKGHSLLLPANATSAEITPHCNSKLLQTWIPSFKGQ